jgi:hypothetical protein
VRAGHTLLPRQCTLFRAPSALASLLLAMAMAMVMAMLSGCGTQAIVVTEAAITDDPDKRVVGWTADEAPQLVFSPEDEEVTLRALFEFNYRGVYEWYKVEWISPDGSPYKVVSLRTDFGSHRDIKASLKIRGKMASRLPGVWRTRLWLIGREGAPDRLLVSRLFRIAEPTREMILAGLTPVDLPKEGAPRPLAKTAVPVVAAAPPSSKPLAAPASAPGPTSNTPKVATDAPPVKDAGPGVPVSAASALPGFPVLPPLAVLLPESAVAGSPASTATPTPDPTAAPAKAAAPAAAEKSTTSAPPAAIVTVPGPARSPPEGPGVLSLSLSSSPGKGPFKPPPALRRYEGCPPMYYPPGPGCVEEAPEE